MKKSYGKNWRLRIPEKLEFLIYPARYKVAYGGRSSAKSWTFARALLKRGIEKTTRVLCAREVQNSIKDSVHKLLKDQIENEGLEGDYEVLDNIIRCRHNGTEFLFTGLLSHTVTSLKSYEAVDVCWVEEAQSVSERSWRVLTPTIRKPGSEIWISFNPDLETDPTYQRFVTNPPLDCISVEVNYNDNPWFNQVMEDERLHCLETDPDNYPNIWEGRCRPAVEGAIFFKEIAAAEQEGRICNVPYDPMLKVHIVSDLGNLDNMFIACVQKHSSEMRIIDCIAGGYRDLNGYSNALKAKPYNWGSWWLPHDGYVVSRQTGKSDADILRAFSWRVPTKDEIVQLGVEAGIRQARLMFPQVYIDRGKCGDLIESLKRYRRHINKTTEAEGGPLHDQFSHGGDCFRYIAVNQDNLTNEEPTDSFPDTMMGVTYGARDSIIGI